MRGILITSYYARSLLAALGLQIVNSNIKSIGMYKKQQQQQQYNYYFFFFC